MSGKRQWAGGVRGEDKFHAGVGTVIISTDVLERTCKGMIENILFCLSNATKGTIYRIGPMPTLRAVRVTSGIRTPGFDDIEWGLPEVSESNHLSQDRPPEQPPARRTCSS